VAGPLCTVPGLIGMTESEARSKVEAAGCVLVTEPKQTSNPSEIGKVTTQSPAADAHVARDSEVKVTLGVQVLGDTLTRTQQEIAAPALVRTGGVALGGLALWLLLGGVGTRLAGSERLWRLVRRRIG
jgi:beta-lactam-binding protein with PASTA domain